MTRYLPEKLYLKMILLRKKHESILEKNKQSSSKLNSKPVSEIDCKSALESSNEKLSKLNSKPISEIDYKSALESTGKSLSNIPKTGLSNLLEGWEEVKIGDIFSERNEKRNDPNLELLSVTLKDGVIKRSEINSKDNSSKDKSNYKLVKPGDIVYNSMRMWQGASGISKYEGLVSPAYTVLSPKNTISSHFFKYYFKTQKMLNKFKKYSQGLTSDTWNLKYPTISQIKIKSPLSKKQKEIENFITHFLSEIDTKITLMETKTRKSK